MIIGRSDNKKGVRKVGRRQTTKYQAAEQAGRRAEYLTRFLYHLAGYRCVAMRQKTPFGELDLIMRRGQKIMVLEVKFRQRMNNLDGGLPSLKQIKRMKNAVLWMSGRYSVFTDKIYILRVVQWQGWWRIRQTDINF